MPSALSTAASAVPGIAPVLAGLRVNGRRVLLVLGFAAGLGLVALGTAPAAGEADPDLMRLLRFMALLKGVFALVALAACYWRLACPANAWREAVYVAGPGLMAAGAACLWQMQAAGASAAILHIGMFALLAAGLTDEAFIPALKRHRA